MDYLLPASISEREMVHFLKKNLRFKEVYRHILYQKIIERNALARGLTVTPEEVQAEANRQRYEKHLEKAADTLAWLAEEMISPEDWKEGIRDRLLAQKLAETLFAKEAEIFYIQNQRDFERALLYQIVVPYEKLARQLFYQIEEQEISFYEAAHLYDIDERRRHFCGFEGKLYRWNLNPEISAVVFSAPPGEIIGPLQTEQGYHLLLVEEFIPAELTPDSVQALINSMFVEWLKIEFRYSHPQQIFSKSL